jgi:CheY-like chemotaxis protein
VVRQPAAGELAQETSETAGQQPSLAGTETILLVEDNPTVRGAARHVLEKYGYQVLEAGNGAKALQMCRTGGAEADLLLCDLVMPGMSGREVAGQLREIRSRMPVLYISGYDHAPAAEENDIVLFRKPFSEQSLICKVRSVLDEARSTIRNKEGK